ncbi:MAG: serine/threonine-protein kinase [Acidobacteria bacterium]|nr:serine/threonine-protein kinase [Acidobacteriota bacterium]
MLAAGTQLGPYEVLGQLGSGGMGEVYRARDPRIGRDVAIKVLPSAFATDADRLRRFEQEVRAAGALNHPNVLIIYDVGAYNGSPYIVSELLEGETLRSRLGGGALPLRKAIDCAQQIARGLAAAHDKGITHRDLKPENIFITKDGRVKILDFGLAKLTRPESGVQEGPDASTMGGQTEPGAVLGTVGYMSPEQVRGQPVDHHSDIFAFGAILYEMISGKRAFRGASAVETMNAILKEDPPDLTATNQSLPPALERIVRHCLEKSPEERFQSARDIGFDLEMLSGVIGPTTVLRAMEDVPAVAAARVAQPVSRKRRLAMALAMLALLVLCSGATYLAGVRSGKSPPPSFHLLTFRRGSIYSARFASDGQTIVYGASWDGKPVEIFSTRPESPDSRALGFPGTDILAVSPSGEMAISLHRHFFAPFISSGTLARASLAGSASREVLEDVQQADWGPDGSSVAVVRFGGGRNRLELPIGKVLYETAGWISHPRVSPRGDLVAFFDHPVVGDDGGAVAVVDLDGKKRILSSGWLSAMGLSWPRQGRDEVWFTATRSGLARALNAVSLAGQERLLARAPGTLTLHDISRDWRALVARDYPRQGIIALAPGETKERDLSWLDFSVPRDLSADGRMLLFDETGEGGGATYAVYIRKTDGSPAVRIGEGIALGFSPDGKWALAMTQSSGNQLTMFPTGPGELKRLPREGIDYQWASWFPDGKRLLVAGSEPGHGVRLYVQDLSGGKPRAITPEGISIRGSAVSPDGRAIICRNPDGKYFLYPADGGEPRSIPGLGPEELPSQWGADGRSLYIFRRGELPARVYRLDLSTGRKELWKQFMPADPTGVDGIGRPIVTVDGKSYVYNYARILSELYVVEGLK